MSELLGKFHKLTGAVSSNEQGQILLYAARIIQRAARMEAPVGKREQYNLQSGRKPPGQLKRSIVAMLGRRPVNGDRAAYVVPVLRARGGKGIGAPHLHLVEYGTTGSRGAKSAGRLAVPRYGDSVKGDKGKRFVRPRSVAPMPAHPFMRRAIASSAPSALEEAARKTEQLILKVLS